HRTPAGDPGELGNEPGGSPSAHGSPSRLSILQTLPALARLMNDLRHHEFRRILLIKPSHIGDVVHTVPLLPKLRARYPDAEIDWFITPENADLVRYHPALSNVVEFPVHDLARFGRGWRATMRPIKRLRDLHRSRYDL